MGRLEKTKNEQDNMINQIKSIFRASEPSSSDSNIKYFGSSRTIVRPPQALIQAYRPRFATHMPRKQTNTEIVTLDDSDIEIIDMPAVIKKPRVLQEIMKELEEDSNS